MEKRTAIELFLKFFSVFTKVFDGKHFTINFKKMDKKVSVQDISVDREDLEKKIKTLYENRKSSNNSIWTKSQEQIVI